VPNGPASGTTCEHYNYGSFNYYLDGGHFQPNPPGMVFDANQCGDLLFQNNTRAFTATYASVNPEESPYKY
jgi:hypothetical protein